MTNTTQKTYTKTEKIEKILRLYENIMDEANFLEITQEEQITIAVSNAKAQMQIGGYVK